MMKFSSYFTATTYLSRKFKSIISGSLYSIVSLENALVVRFTVSTRLDSKNGATGGSSYRELINVNLARYPTFA